MAAAHEATVNSLGDDVLGEIFLLLPPMDRCHLSSLWQDMPDDRLVKRLPVVQNLGAGA
jgi:hypothetical protein